MKTFFTADWHLGEDRFSIMQRPFQSVDDHINTIIANHNALVTNDDLVYVNGDVIYQKASPNYLKLINKFNGRKVLIRGNHDRVFTDEQFSPYFEQIIPEGSGIDLDIEGIPCYLTHYPSQGKKDIFNLVAHIHSAWKFQLNMLNVGVDVHHFHPVNSKFIPFIFKAIVEFYDSDIWAGYNDINQAWYNIRGKKTSYWELKC